MLSKAKQQALLRKKEREKKEKAKELRLKGLTKCINCKHAYLMREDGNDPIIAECKITHDREVARMFLCENGFFEDLSGATAEIHPMIFVGRKS